jgi:hypothetical protein
LGEAMQNLKPNAELFIDWEDTGLLAKAAGGNTGLPHTARELLAAVQNHSLETPEGQAYIQYLTGFMANQAYTAFVSEALGHAYLTARRLGTVPALISAMGRIVNGEIKEGATLADALDMNEDERLKGVIVDKGFLPFARTFYENIQNQKTSGCFIATACYGSVDNPAVMDFRWFRDSVLSKAELGRLFTRVYCSASPPIAAFLDGHPRMADMVRSLFLSPIWFIVARARRRTRERKNTP